MGENKETRNSHSLSIIIVVLVIITSLVGGGLVHLVKGCQKTTSENIFSINERVENPAGGLTAFETEEYSVFDNFTKSTNYLYYDDSILYAAKDNKIELYNVSSSDNPQLIGDYQATLGVYFRTLLLKGDLLFATIYDSPIQYYSTYSYYYGSTYLLVLNCSDLKNITLLTSYDFLWGSSFAVSDNYLIVNDNELTAYNITNLAFPELLWRIPEYETSIVCDFAFSGNIVFIFCELGLRAYDLTNISSPTFLGLFPVQPLFCERDLTDFQIINGTLGLIHEFSTNEISVYDLANPLEMNFLGKLETASINEKHILFTPNYLFSASGDSVSVYKFNSKTELQFVGEYSDPYPETYNRFDHGGYYSFKGIIKINDRLYLWRQTFYQVNFILYVLDVSDPINLQLIWKTAINDPTILARKLTFIFTFILPAFWVIYLIGLLVRTVVRKRVERNNNQQNGENIETIGTLPEEKNVRILTMCETPKGQKLLLIGFFVLFVQNILVLISIFITFGHIQLHHYITSSGYVLSVPFFLDLFAALILFIGFSWNGFEKKSKLSVLAAVLWMGWIVIAIYYRLLMGMPSYKTLLYNTIYGSSSLNTQENLIQGYYYMTYYLLSTIMFSFTNFATLKVLNIKNTLKIGYNTYIWFNTIIGYLSVYFMFVQLDCELLRVEYYSFLYDFIYPIIECLINSLKSIVIPIIGLVVFYNIFRDLKLQLPKPDNFRVFSGWPVK